MEIQDCEQYVREQKKKKLFSAAGIHWTMFSCHHKCTLIVAKVKTEISLSTLSQCGWGNGNSEHDDWLTSLVEDDSAEAPMLQGSH